MAVRAELKEGPFKGVLGGGQCGMLPNEGIRPLKDVVSSGERLQVSRDLFSDGLATFFFETGMLK